MKFLRMVLGGGPGLTTWFLEGVGQMTMFDHDGGRGVKISEKSDHVVYGWPHWRASSLVTMKTNLCQ